LHKITLCLISHYVSIVPLTIILMKSQNGGVVTLVG